MKWATSRAMKRALACLLAVLGVCAAVTGATRLRNAHSGQPRAKERSEGQELGFVDVGAKLNYCDFGGQPGRCINVRKKSCSSDTLTGLCRGNRHRRCCPSKIPCLKGQAGHCIHVKRQQCQEQTLVGFCPGNRNIKCCPSSSDAADASRMKSTTAGGEPHDNAR